MELDKRGAELLFQVLTDREQKASVATATNESFSGWTKTFADPRLCAATVDWLTFGGDIIETGTDAYWLHATGMAAAHLPRQLIPHRCQRPARPARLRPDIQVLKWITEHLARHGDGLGLSSGWPSPLASHRRNARPARWHAGRDLGGVPTDVRSLVCRRVASAIGRRPKTRRKKQARRHPFRSPLMR